MGWHFSTDKQQHPDFRVKSRKPTGPTKIDWDHPITRNLILDIEMNEGAGRCRDLVTGRIAGQNGHEWSSKKGPLHTTFSTSTNDSIDVDWLDDFSGPDHTVYIRGRITNFDSSGTILLSWNDNGLPFWRIDANLANVYVGGNLIAGSDHQGATDEWQDWVFVSNSKTNDCYFYENGELLNQGSVAEDLNTGAKSIKIGRWPGSNNFSLDGGMQFCRVWNRALTSGEVAQLWDDAYTFIEPAVPLQYFTPSAAGGDTNVSATSASLTLTEYQATVNAETSITAGFDALTLTEYNATVSAGTNIAAGFDSLAITEYAATVNAETNVNAGFDALSITEYQASVTTTSDTNVAAGVDNLVLTEYQATIKADNSVAAGFDALVITEYSATVTIGANISASTDSLALTEYAATIKADTSVSAGLDALTLTEYAASISSGGALTAHHTVYATAKKMTTRANAKKMTVNYHG
jgi:hypothetical protein